MGGFHMALGGRRPAPGFDLVMLFACPAASFSLHDVVTVRFPQTL